MPYLLYFGGGWGVEDLNKSNIWTPVVLDLLCLLRHCCWNLIFIPYEFVSRCILVGCLVAVVPIFSVIYILNGFTVVGPWEFEWWWCQGCVSTCLLAFYTYILVVTGGGGYIFYLHCGYIGVNCYASVRALLLEVNIIPWDFY